MYFLKKQHLIKLSYAVGTILVVILMNFSLAHATTVLITNQTDWEAQVMDIELFETTADNIYLADEVTAYPSMNDQLGPVLTFQSVNTGLSRSFMVEALEQDAGFTFNETESGSTIASFQNALSVGDIDEYEDDDWQLSILDGEELLAFGVEIRHSRFAEGETMTLYSEGVEVGSVDLSTLPNTGNETYFLGIISDVPFDSIGFNEDPDGDDIAIADFRFATVPPAIEARVYVMPRVINLKSHGRFITVSIILPYGYSVKDVDIQSIAISKINGDIITSPLKAVDRPYYTHFFWSRVRHLTAKFDRQALISLLEETDRSITVSGELKDGTKFSGTGRIVVINPGHHKNHIFWQYNALLHAFQIWNLR